MNMKFFSNLTASGRFDMYCRRRNDSTGDIYVCHETIFTVYIDRAYIIFAES